MNLPNPVLAKLRRGEVSIGSWLNLASPLAAEVMAVGGCEWLVIDAEHAPWDLGLITEGIRAIESQGCVPLVRPWTNDPAWFGQILDAGAMGLVVPHVSTVAQAEAIAGAVRYPPQGHRSSGTSRATIDRGWTAQANDHLIICPQIEDLEGADNTAKRSWPWTAWTWPISGRPTWRCPWDSRAPTCSRTPTTRPR